MGKHKVVYYNVDDTLDFENSLLKEWGADDIELVEVKNGEDRDKPEAFLEATKGAEGVVVEYFQITKDVLAKAEGLRIVSLQAIGVSNVDIAAATEHGVCVTNSPGFCTEEVALHTVGMMIDCVRKITFHDRNVRSGKWDPLLGGKTFRMSGKTVGLVFFGSIPKYMIPILQSMDMNVQVYAPTKTKEFLDDYGCKKIDTLDELLKTSDFVSMHTPLIPGVTEHMMGEAQFRMMKNTAYFINTARGGVVDEPALVKALKEGWIKAAAVDVIEDEANEKSDLFVLDNCIITPHAAFVSEDSFAEARIIALRQLKELLHDGKIPSNLVNKAVADKISL
ncbi:MAG: C-terminal binding protein [Clostridiales Family XIII bacterium]|jgi:D-3-phosphoglycerate dehydrogenase|nr:C-terminal binding protein [Clostridiales Family XIII bacterium]